MESSGIYSLNRKSVLNGGSTVSRLNRYVIDVIGHRSHIHYYCNCNQSNDGFRKERQILHRAIQPTYRQPEESSTYEEENPSDAEGTVSQLESQETPQTTLTYYRR